MLHFKCKLNFSIHLIYLIQKCTCNLPLHYFSSCKGIVSNMSVSASQSSPRAQKRHISREYEQNGGIQYRSRQLGIQIFR